MKFVILRFPLFSSFLLALSLIDIVKANTECRSYDDPHMTTFDGINYEFQYSGDHFILYDDFKDTRVTASYQSCGARATCNCAVYLKKGRKVAFVDFCSTINPASPTSQLYGVTLAKDAIGLKSIKKMPPCQIIAPQNENNPSVWANVSTFLDDFKCVRLQGSNHYDLYVIRTVEKDFQDSVKIKFKLATRTLPTLDISPSLSSFNATGGLCAMWDNNRNRELYVLDEDGVEQFLPNTNDVEVAREFWRLNSCYNKNYYAYKRCPECYLMSERPIYCPCDDFDLYDDSNYNVDCGRPAYCKVPMFRCIEILNNLNETTTTTAQPPTGSTTTKKPITPEIAEELCVEAILDHPALKPLIENGCFHPNETIEICILDLLLTGDEDLINLHIQTAIDEAIQNILNGLSNCTIDFLITLCPNNCSNNGICELNQDCLIDPKANFNEDCLAPVKCNCIPPWGGIDCSVNIEEVPSVTLDRTCCDLRNETCDEINAFGFPFSKRDKIYARIDLVEENREEINILREIVIAITLSESNLVINLNRIEELSVYKNIYDLATPDQFKPRQSQARALIYLSYVQNQTLLMDKPSASFTLYDSKCRLCINKETDIIDEKCDIEGKCYDENDTKPGDEDFVCSSEKPFEWTYRPTPTISISTTTEPGESCNSGSYWSQWYNIDSPDGNGDLELIEMKGIGCASASLWQVETVDGVPYDKTNQTVHLKPCMGFMCLNVQNKEPCFDYRIRKCCPIEPTTTEEPTTSTEEEPTTETTEEITTTTTTKLTTTTKPNCDFVTLEIANNMDLLVVWENASYLDVKFEIKSNRSECIFVDTLSLTARTKGYTAEPNKEYTETSRDFQLDENNRVEFFRVPILDDQLIEQFKFFAIEITSQSASGNIYTNKPRLIVYVEDNDYIQEVSTSGNKVFDILHFNKAKSEISIAFVSNSGSFLNLTNTPYEICPFRKGITSNYDKLKILMEFFGFEYHKLHTLEVHNPGNCNLKAGNARSLNFSQRPKGDYMNTLLLRNRPVVDVDYYKTFYGLTLTSEDLEILEINWLETSDKKSPGPCELRAFVEVF